MVPYKNVLDAFWEQVASRGGERALATRTGDSWKSISWREFGEQVASLTSALKHLDLSRDAKVAVFSDNGPEWLIADYAILSAGMVSVPLYPNQTIEQLRFILENSQAEAVFVKGAERLKKTLEACSLNNIIFIGEDGPRGPREHSFEKMIRAGGVDTFVLREEARAFSGRKLATIPYTSGTTAFPKGVMLTHGNIIAEIEMLSTRSIRQASDDVLSFLPLPHMAERMNQFRQAITGYAIHFGGGIETLARDLREVRPTSFGAVPRIYEKFQEAIRAKLAKDPSARVLFERLLSLAERELEAKRKGRWTPLLSARLKLLQRVVAPDLKKLIGLDRSNNFIGGAAPLSLSTLTFFYALGMSVIEVYGLTEVSGASHYNSLTNPVFGTVGPCLNGMECKIADDGEILLKGANVFEGYYRDPEATREAFSEGWFHTGDIGQLDGDGCLKITDRKKSIIVTAAGKNIAPAPIEALLRRSPIVSQVVVVGDKRKYLTALFTLVSGQRVRDAEPLLEEHLNSVNAGLASYQTVKHFRILENDFSVEGGELTPSLKIKRSFVQEKYKAVIDTMYETNYEKERSPLNEHRT
ncbi:MAG: long-chain fatty acid--CoA ligase [Bdellovibrionia bacterium]